MQMVFKPFRAEEGCLSFLIGDKSSGKICLIDPRFDQIDQYEAAIAANGLAPALVPVLVIDTHTHADHYSGSHVIAERFGVPIAMGENTGSARAAKKLRDKETLEIGSKLAIEVLATPGHTPDSVSLVATFDWGKLAFTGDTLFLGGSGRTDFPGASAKDQFESLHKKLGALPDATWVLPGHDYSGLFVSTIGHEKKTNPHLLIRNVDEFIRMKEKECLEGSGIVQPIVAFNMNAKPLGRPRGGAHTMCATVCADARGETPRVSVKEFQSLLGAGGDALFLDIREPEERAQSQIEGLRSIPMGELLAHWSEISRAGKVYVFCQQGNRSLLAAQSAARLGLKNVIDVQGGMVAWMMAGLPVKKG